MASWASTEELRLVLRANDACTTATQSVVYIAYKLRAIVSKPVQITSVGSEHVCECVCVSVCECCVSVCVSVCVCVCV